MRVLLCSILFSCIAGCGDKAEGPAAPSGPIVSVLELPISLRSRAAAPSDVHDVEISATEIHVAAQPVITLAAGAIPAADRQGEQVPKLAAALSKAPHAGLGLAIASGVPYETVALVLATAKAAGVRSVAFKVRAPGNTSSSGWLTLDALDVQPKSKTDQEVVIQGATKKAWGDFAAQWEAVQNACRASPTGSCAYKPEKIAEGGDLKIVLHTAGQGVNIDFFRIGGPPPEAAAPAAEKPGKKKRKVELIDGVKKPKDIVAEAEEAAPATEASFQFRAQEAVATPSAVSETIKPVCGGGGCGVVVQAEKATLFVRIASLLGAAFPDGMAAPRVVFELP